MFTKNRLRRKFDILRSSEYSRLDPDKHVYLDHTGAALHPETVSNRHADMLRNHVFGNPHSGNPTSKAATKLVDEIRNQILEFFNASTSEYCVIFTSNASGALKLVAESFPFQSSSSLLLLADNHNSVHGIREYAVAAKASVRYIGLDEEMRAHRVKHHLTNVARRHPNSPNLFAYPAQSNFSGVQHSLSYISYAQSQNWTVLLDAAAFVPTSPLDLSKVSPDFVAISFYKIIGYPTGIGALIAKRSSLRLLKRPWFGGGTVAYVGVANPMHVLKSDNPEAFEDGTLNFLSIACLKDGLNYISAVSMPDISKHVKELTALLFEGFKRLRYSHNKPAVRIYGPLNTVDRGGCIAFDVLDQRGRIINPSIVELEANKRNISLRTGCFCNPGAAEHALDKDVFDEQDCIEIQGTKNVTMESMSKCMGQYLGCIRISVGLSTNIDDINRFLKFVHDFCSRYLSASSPFASPSSALSA